MTQTDVQVIQAKLDGLAVMVGRLEERMDARIGPGDAPMCAVHEERMERLNRRLTGVEGVQGKHHIIVLILGAIGAGIGMVVKGLWEGWN